jgi:hypothetical protein
LAGLATSNLAATANVTMMSGALPKSIKRFLLIETVVCIAVGVVVALWLMWPHDRTHDHFGPARARMITSAVRAYQAEYGAWPPSIDALGGKFLLREGIETLVKRGYRLRIEPPSRVIVEWPDRAGELQQVIDIGDDSQPEP